MLNMYTNIPTSVDEAASYAHTAVFSNMGQCCVAGTRCFVQEDVYDKFVEKVKLRAANRVVGDPWDMRTESGPQVYLNS